MIFIKQFIFVILLLFIDISLCKKTMRKTGPEKNGVHAEEEYSLNPSFRKPIYMQNVNKKRQMPGSDVYLPCMAAGIRPILYRWTFNGEKLIGKKNRHKFTYNQSMLKIKRIRYSDVGTYVCTASNIYGNLSYAFQLQLKDKTKEPVFYDKNLMLRKQRHISPTHQTVKLHCQAEAKKDVHYIWLKNGKPFIHFKPIRGKSNMVTKAASSQNGDLVLTNLKVSDGGQYTCVAFNRYGNVSFTYELRILRKLSGGPPKVIPFTRPQNLIANVGENVSFDCLEIISVTIPDVRWFHLYNMKDRRELPVLPKDVDWSNIKQSGHSYDLEYLPTSMYSTFRLNSTNGKPKNEYIFDDTDPSGLRLTLHNVTMKHTGIYTCYVSNFEGSDYALFYLTVTDNKV